MLPKDYELPCHINFFDYTRRCQGEPFPAPNGITNWSFTKIDIAVLVSVHEGQKKYVHVYMLIELL